MTVVRLFVTALLIGLSGGAGAQQPARDLAAQAAAMRELAFLQGRWLGQGWRNLPSGERVQSTQSIFVEPRASGLALIVEGISLRQPAPETKPSTASLAVVTYDERARRYRFRSFGFGEIIEAEGELIAPGKFQWTVPAGPAMLRFVVDGSGGTWQETGLRSGDGGKSWTPLYALTAHRTGDR